MKILYLKGYLAGESRMACRKLSSFDPEIINEKLLCHFNKLCIFLAFFLSRRQISLGADYIKLQAYK